MRKLTLKKMLARTLMVCGAAALIPAAHAWEPTKTVEFVVPAGTGGGADQMARFIQGVVTKHNLMKQPMVVLNKAGGAGAEGFLDVKGDKGNAHKIVITHTNLDATWSSGAAQAIYTVAANQVVARAGFRLVTAFQGGGTSALALIVGDGNDTDRFIVSKSVHNDDTPITAWASNAATMPYAYTGADTVDAICTASAWAACPCCARRRKKPTACCRSSRS